MPSVRSNKMSRVCAGLLMFLCRPREHKASAFHIAISGPARCQYYGRCLRWLPEPLTLRGMQGAHYWRATAGRLRSGLGGYGLLPAVIADHEAEQTAQQPERRRCEQSLFLEEAVDQHDHDAEAGETLCKDSRTGIKPPRLQRHGEAESERCQ